MYHLQIQDGDGEIENNGPPMPVIDHPLLGNALNISLVRQNLSTICDSLSAYMKMYEEVLTDRTGRQPNALGSSPWRRR